MNKRDAADDRKTTGDFGLVDSVERSSIIATSSPAGQDRTTSYFTQNLCR